MMDVVYKLLKVPEDPDILFRGKESVVVLVRALKSLRQVFIVNMTNYFPNDTNLHQVALLSLVHPLLHHQAYGRPGKNIKC